MPPMLEPRKGKCWTNDGKGATACNSLDCSTLRWLVVEVRRQWAWVWKRRTEEMPETTEEARRRGRVEVEKGRRKRRRRRWRWSKCRGGSSRGVRRRRRGAVRMLEASLEMCKARQGSRREEEEKCDCHN